MFIRLHLMERDSNESILVRPEEIVAIERHYDDGDAGSVLFLRSNDESIYVVESQQEVYELIVGQAISTSIDMELGKDVSKRPGKKPGRGKKK